MIDLPTPPPIFNPLTAPADQALTVWEILAGPFGLLAFLPLIPILRLIARRRPRTALIACGVVWIFATLGPLATVVLLGGCAAGAGWVLTLARLRAREKLGRRSMIAQSGRT